MRKLKFSNGLLEPTINGTKLLTIRKYRKEAHDFLKKEVFQGQFEEGVAILLKATASTEFTQVKNITDKLACEDGFKDAKDAQEGLKKFYPDIGPSDVLAIIRYEVLTHKDVNGVYPVICKYVLEPALMPKRTTIDPVVDQE